MRHYGNINLQQNELQNAVLPIDTYFPTNPKVGQLVFKDKVLYICVEIQNQLPIWTPLTNQIDAFIFTQTTPAATTINQPVVRDNIMPAKLSNFTLLR